jgi:thioredoxin 1
MIELRGIVTGAAGEKGGPAAAKVRKAGGHRTHTIMCWQDHPREQSKKRRRMNLFTIAALFLLSICTRAALAGQIKPYNQADLDKLAAEGKPILLDFRADWCTTCAAQAPLIRDLLAQSKYKDLTTFTIDFDRDTALLKAYNVEVQSTLIVLTGKQEEGRSIGDTSREGIEHLLNKVVR